MDVVPPHSTEIALEHTAWLRRLAVRLVRDPDLADDVLQDTWVRALETPPAAGERGSVRAWLATVLRNVVRKRWQQQARVRSLDADELAGAEASSVDDLFALQRELLEAVDRLEGVERETILLRYFEELPPRAIAARLGVPVKTVNSRLYRALERLRGRLDAQHDGDRRSWVLCFLPLVAERPLRTALTAGTLLMGTKIALALLASGVAAFFSWQALRPPSNASAPDVASVGVSNPVEPAPPLTLTPAADVGTERSEVAVAATVEEQASAALISGRAVLDDGTPVARLRLRVALQAQAAPEQTSPVPTRMTTDALGGFSAAILDWREVRSDDVAFADVIVPVVSAASRTEPVLVVAPNRPLSGVVVDPNGEPIEGAGLQLILPTELHARTGAVFGSHHFERFIEDTGGDGAFAFAVRPHVAGAMLAVKHPDFELLELVPPDEARSDLRIELTPRVSSTGELAGVVLDPEGYPVAGAQVALGETVVSSDADGSFHFRFDEVEVPNRLMAVKPGFLPAIENGVETPDGWSWPEFVELVFAGEPKSIAGVVVDNEDAPVPGAVVWIQDPTRLGFSGAFPVDVERELLEESVLWVRAIADPNGRFVHRGLMDRPYQLRAGNPRTAEISAIVTAAPGDEAVIRFSPDATTTLEGRVVDGGGRAVAGARLSIERIAHVVEDAEGNRYVSQLHGRTVATAADGTFAIERVPRAGCDLRVHGQGVFSMQMELELEDGAAPLELVVYRECHLRVEVQSPDLDADTLVLLDAFGDAVMTQRYVRDARHNAYLVPLESGEQTLTVPESAVTAVFRKGDVERLRLPVSLDPNEVAYLRP